jgi:hypothetical protein
VPAHVRDVQAVTARQGGRDVVPRARVITEAVQQDDRRRLRVALHPVCKPDPVDRHDRATAAGRRISSGHEQNAIQPRAQA